MINGSFGDEDALTFEIDLIASNRSILVVDAMFDTGFSYWLAIDDQDINAFGWNYIDLQTMQTARGKSKFKIYFGKLKFDGQEYDIPVHVGKGLNEALLGRQWLTTKRLLVDMPSNLLTIG